jgi:RNA polymerase sigma factor (sigma-70 family)
MSDPGDQDVAQLERLLEAVTAGDESAVRQFLEVYEPHIRRVARRMQRTRRSSHGSDDFVQDVWASFFRRLPNLPHVERPRALINYLRMMTKHKVIDLHRREDRRRTVALRPSHSDDSLPPPLEAVQAEEWQRLSLGKPAEEHVVVRLWQGGQRPSAIALATGNSLRRVQRILSAAVQTVRGRLRTRRE